MIEDRALYILGGGGFLAVLCLLPNWPFAVKIASALVILVIAMVFALMKLGPDQDTIEGLIFKRLRFLLATKKYNYYGRAQNRGVAGDNAGAKQAASIWPIYLDWDATNVYFLLTVWLAVIGIYFTVWLHNGGAAELARWIVSN